MGMVVFGCWWSLAGSGGCFLLWDFVCDGICWLFDLVVLVGYVLLCVYVSWCSLVLVCI